jgi:hypothetical protein
MFARVPDAPYLDGLHHDHEPSQFFGFSTII